MRRHSGRAPDTGAPVRASRARRARHRVREMSCPGRALRCAEPARPAAAEHMHELPRNTARHEPVRQLPWPRSGSQRCRRRQTAPALFARSARRERHQGLRALPRHGAAGRWLAATDDGDLPRLPRTQRSSGRRASACRVTEISKTSTCDPRAMSCMDRASSRSTAPSPPARASCARRATRTARAPPATASTCRRCRRRCTSTSRTGRTCTRRASSRATRSKRRSTRRPARAATATRRTAKTAIVSAACSRSARRTAVRIRRTGSARLRPRTSTASRRAATPSRARAVTAARAKCCAWAAIASAGRAATRIRRASPATSRSVSCHVGCVTRRSRDERARAARVVHRRRPY